MGRLRETLGCCGLVAALVVGLSFSPAAVAQGTDPSGRQAASGPGQVVVLDTTGFWRMHHTLKPPVIQSADGPKAIPFKQKWLNHETPAPPANWTGVDFDDCDWLRGPGRMAAQTPFLSRLCMRGAFEVSDPSRVKDLRLSVAYRGGVIVYLNGQEVTRQHVAAGAGAGPLADGYPADAFAPDWGWGGKPPANPQAEPQAMAKLRTRRLENVAVPAGLLRKGVNVLAMEIVRAPYHAVLEEKKNPRSRECPYELFFNTCEFCQVQLTAARADGLVPNAARQPGFHVWNTNLLAADFDLDFGGQAEPLRPVRLAGVRSGEFSGKIAVGSTGPIRGLKATAGNLRSAEGKVIAASAVRIRYGLPWGFERGEYLGYAADSYYGVTPEHMRYPRQPTMLGALWESAPQVVPVSEKKPGKFDLKTPGQPDPVFGAVASVWITVNVPRGAAPALYSGQVAVAAAGQNPVSVPVELKVLDWTLPNPEDYVGWVELVQSPDTLALEYGADLWSDRHFELIARSMKLLGEVGCGIVYIPLIAQTNLGNAESMVRWIQREGGGYDFDFSVMDRYLDLAVKNMGRPRVVCFVVWDIYLGEGGGYKDDYSSNQEGVKERMKFAGKGPLVTALDPKTRKTETVHAPRTSDPASRGIWKDLFDQLRKRMQQRGLEKAMMIGLMADDWPSKEENSFYHDVTGGLPWVSHSHIEIGGSAEAGHPEIIVAGVNRQGDQVVDRTGIRVGFRSAVLQCDCADDDPPLGSHLGWKRPDLATYQPRYESAQPGSRWRNLIELNVTGRQRGISRGGADFWNLKDKRGVRSFYVTSRYPHSVWRNLNIPWCLLAPGEGGAVATHAFEAFREGRQECEARIFVEKALADPALRGRLGEALAARCEKLLTERTYFLLKACTNLQLQGLHYTMARPIVRENSMAGHAWFVGSGWQERSAELYMLAGEVDRRLAVK